ncbi:uncharacterized protein Triagg1_6846 [Trichoderma aggressivum f. europaeum]|uniref:Uncharacterized protein n=1 Tax=Trichoderma aggressivum f. europaeum TaxID=173218 RepID=A0AAE1M1F1_9HYPO|nr:hypothetical protein Triagg1_6846 [Trichoderma aggressivum f. europaeum]
MLHSGLPPIVWGMLADDIPANDLEKPWPMKLSRLPASINLEINIGDRKTSSVGRIPELGLHNCLRQLERPGTLAAELLPGGALLAAWLLDRVADASASTWVMAINMGFSKRWFDEIAHERDPRRAIGPGQATTDD